MKGIAAVGVAFCAGLLLATGIMAAKYGTRLRALSAAMAETTPVPACHCSFLPVVVNEPAPTCTPTVEPTETSIPLPTWTPTLPPPTPPYTRPTLAILPPTQTVTLGELAQVSAWLGPVADVQAVEARIFYNPVMLDFDSVGPGDLGLDCDVASVFSVQPGVVRFECESSEPISGSGTLLELTYRAVATGTAMIEPWGAATFVGISNGWGYWPATVTGTVEIR